MKQTFENAFIFYRLFPLAYREALLLATHFTRRKVETPESEPHDQLPLF